MDYQDSISYIESLAPMLADPSLERFQLFMAGHGDIQNSFPSFHVGGTNGKGSTVAILDSILRESGLRVGRFTGPHLLRWNERLHVDGKPISDERFAQLATSVREKSEAFAQKNARLGALTWFEFLTAMCFFYFAEEQVDIAVLEVGLGGRFDATNVHTNVLAQAITNVDLDHTQILGDTVEQIAFEKAGIIKGARPVITGASAGALKVLETAVEERGGVVVHCGRNGSQQFTDLFSVAKSGQLGEATEKLCGQLDSESLFSCLKTTALAGLYQKENALLAVATLLCAGAHLLPSSTAAYASIARGLKSVYWPGRLQYLPNSSLILEGAHNPAGAKATRNALDELYPGAQFTFVLSCYENKDVSKLVSNVVYPGDTVFASEADGKRKVCPASELVRLSQEQGAKAYICKSIGEALSKALSFSEGRRSKGGLVVATGSLATVKEVMQAIGWTSVEEGRSATGMLVGSA